MTSRTIQKRILVPTLGADSWRALLADPEKHWQPGFSAHALATRWEAANGIPSEICECFAPAGMKEPELLLAVPEWRTQLTDRLRASQSDLFALMRCGDQTFAVTIEGRVNETFGPTVEEWLSNRSPARPKRLTQLCGVIGVTTPVPGHLRYQLFHRTASAVIEARRFGADAAAMIVHSFSPDDRWFGDFAAFAEFLGASGSKIGHLTQPLDAVVPLHLGWASAH